MFISIEGGEGAGKSSAINTITEVLTEHNIEHVCTREPGGTPLAENIRQVLLEPNSEAMQEETELLLMFAARVQHVKSFIQPQLAEGKWVICDRFTDATYAYQGGGRGIDNEKISALENWSLAGFKPDATLYLDVSIETGLARAKERGALDRFEQETRDFFQRVIGAYQARIAAEPQRFICIDAEQTLATVQRDLRVSLINLIEKS